MSDENVERLRAFCATWDRDDPPDFLLLDPDVVFEDDLLPDHAGETYRGREGVMRSIRTWVEPYERFTIELEEIVESGDRLVSIHRFRYKAQYTGIEGEMLNRARAVPAGKRVQQAFPARSHQPYGRAGRLAPLNGGTPNGSA
jgi:ketosteroid isomerase-like protein